MIPGAFGAICMVVALFGFSVLPLSWAGLALVLLGVALLVIDLHVPSHGALTLSGLVAMAIGMITLFHNAPAPYHTSEPLVDHDHGAARRPLGVRDLEGGRRQTAAGTRRPAGDRRHGRSRASAAGSCFVRGELWRAESDRPLREGEQVQVEALDGLSLRVRHI